jgi:hypothetical protein
VEIEGELERIHHHRGIVLGLKVMEESFDRLGMTEAARLCRGCWRGWEPNS